MMINKLFFLAAWMMISSQSFGQILTNFENIPLTNGINNGADQSGGFQGNGIYLPNTYDQQFAFWTGFSVSERVDTTTGGFTGQYNTYAGNAFSGTKFGMGYASYDPIFIRNSNPLMQKQLVSFRYTNSTYAALSMKNGDAFSKKFGGVSGNDPDFFSLTVYNYFNGQKTDSAIYYLADYRNPNNGLDYIQKDWALSFPEFDSPFDSLGFELKSSDNGNFGMNTPAYFCIDDITITDYTSNRDSKSNQLVLFPNPARESLKIRNTGNAQDFEIYRPDGKLTLKGSLENEVTLVPISSLPSGTYFLRTSAGGMLRFTKI